MTLNRWMMTILSLLLIALFTGCGFSDPASDASDGDADSPPSDGDADLPDEEIEAEALDLIEVTPPDNWNPTAARTPTAVHLTYQHDPADRITLQWQTEEKDETTYTPKVWLARASDIAGSDTDAFEEGVAMPWNADLTAEGIGVKYCSQYVCTAKNMTGLQWAVEISGLEPDTFYYYRVGTWESFDETTGVFTGAELSEPYRFRTGLPKGSAQPFTFGFGSDSQNWFPEITQKVTEIRQDNGHDARFWLFGGDLTETGTQQELWDWFVALAPLIHYFPFMPVQGNHDIFTSALYGEFSLPRVEALEDDYKEYGWSFNYGNGHFIGFNSVAESVVEHQLAWLEQDLQAASTDPEIDWIIVIHHHPMYSSSSVHGGTDYLVDLVLPLLDRYHVDLTFSGHDHDYERTKPMREGQIVDPGEGTVYIVSGGFYSKKSYGNGTSDFTEISVDGETKSYVILNIDGKTLTGTAYAGNHQELDSFTLTKE